jgi:hypothetical protein
MSKEVAYQFQLQWSFMENHLHWAIRQIDRVSNATLYNANLVRMNHDFSKFRCDIQPSMLRHYMRMSVTMPWPVSSLQIYTHQSKNRHQRCKMLACSCFD